ncbi:B-cell scaffold protein with ankyrin repeats isoform X2 [Ambystoma mexicanum]|uniref:B-cell scaffold protein with ankyrin repeats isoform X2 n=1 Tax=Ambystoma mexicanum TaxID=8296 RepID=UPI0037E9BEC1
MTASEHAGDLLVIFEEEAEDWASYLRSIFENNLVKEIRLYSLEDSSYQHLPALACFRCKLLILSQRLLTDLDDMKISFLLHLLHPPDCVVILLCGVDDSDALYELVPIGRVCHEIFTDQDPEHYLSVVRRVMHQGFVDTETQEPGDPRTFQEEPEIPQTTVADTHTPDLQLYSHPISEDSVPPDDLDGTAEVCWNISPDSPKAGSDSVSVMVLPKRISCEDAEELAIVLKGGSFAQETIEIEFTTKECSIRIQPEVWNDNVFCLKAPDLPAGTVNINVYCEGVIKATAQVEYYTAMGEIETLLRKVADPVHFICQAFNAESKEEIDTILTHCLQGKMPVCKVARVLDDVENQHEHDTPSKEYPTLLHCAANFGFKNLTTLLTQCPGASLASKMINKYGDDPASLAKKQGHTDLHSLIQNLSVSSRSTSEVEQHHRLYHSPEKTQHVPRKLTPETDLHHLDADACLVPTILLTTSGNEYVEEAEEEQEEDSEYVAMHAATDPQSSRQPCRDWQEDLWEAGTEEERANEEEEAGKEGEEEEDTYGNYRDSFDYADNLYDEIEKKDSVTEDQDRIFFDKPPLPAPRPPAAPLTKEDMNVYSQDKSSEVRMENQCTWYEAEDYREDEEEFTEEEDPYSLATNDADLYDMILNTGQSQRRRGSKSFIMHRPPAPVPRQEFSVSKHTESSTPFIAQVFQQKGATRSTRSQSDPGKDVYGTRHPGRGQSDSQQTYVALGQRRSLPSGQEELILMQEKVKRGLMTMDEALEKFKRWQNEQSSSDHVQKEKKLRQLRGCIIGKRPEEYPCHDKITIVHQPKAAEKTRRGSPVLETVYATANKPLPPPRIPMERDHGNLRKGPKIN